MVFIQVGYLVNGLKICICYNIFNLNVFFNFVFRRPDFNNLRDLGNLSYISGGIETDYCTFGVVKDLRFYPFF